MNDLIFGYTWEQIQAAQQGKPFRKYICGSSEKPQAKAQDIKLLVENGLDWLEQQQFFGVIDRLRNSGIIE